MSHTPRKTTEAQETKRNPEPRAIEEQPLEREKAEVGMRSLWSIRENTARASALVESNAAFQILYTATSCKALMCTQG